MIKGTIFNIQKYSIHDGPGIRTTVFFKGCPLSCWWCHNPESTSIQSELIYLNNKCIRCGDCVKSCPNEALTMSKEGVEIDRKKCNMCEACIEACPTTAIEKVGELMTISEVMEEIEKDSIFYEQSNGGVTFSGGEPMHQIEFLSKLIDACKEKHIHVALDTSGYAPWKSFEKIIDKVDLFLYDIKIMDDVKHKKYTGVSNKLILENLKKLAGTKIKIWIRVPIIPGINDDYDNIEKMGEMLLKLNLRDVFFLPYHNTAIDKYSRIEKSYMFPEVKSLTNKQTEIIAKKISKFNLNIKIGG